MGFSFDQATVLMGKFEKEGVNTELVMGSLRMALGKLARDGEPVVETFQRTVDEIKNAGSTSEANAKALELFGARAGPDMAAAIREGRFEIDDLMKSMENTDGAIAATSESTLTWQQKLGRLRNKVLVKLEPTLMKLVDGLGEAADWLGVQLPKAIDATGKFIEDVRPTVEDLWEHFEIGLEVVYPLVRDFAKFIIDHKPVLVAAIVAIGVAIAAALGPGAAALLALVGIITVIGYVKDNIGAFRDFVVGKFTEIKDKVMGVITPFTDWLREHWKLIVTIALGILFPLGAGLFLIITHFNTLKDRVMGPVNAIKDTVVGKFNAIKDTVVGKFTEIKDTVVGKFNAIIDFLEGLPGRFSSAGTNLSQALADAVKGGMNALITFFEDGLNKIIGVWNSLEFKVPKVNLGPLGSIGGGTVGVPDIPLVNIPRLEKGAFDILTDTLAQLHKGEMVVSQPFAEGLRAQLRQPVATRASGGVTNFYFGDIHLSGKATREDARDLIEMVEGEWRTRRRRGF
jgi:phage-related minor tail protein